MTRSVHGTDSRTGATLTRTCLLKINEYRFRTSWRRIWSRSVWSGWRFVLFLSSYRSDTATRVCVQHRHRLYRDTKNKRQLCTEYTHTYSNPHRLFWGHGRHPKLFIPLLIPLFLTSYYYLYCTDTNTFCDICNMMIIAFYLFHPIGIIVKACAKQ